MFLNAYHAQAAELGLTVKNSGASIAAYAVDGRYVGSLRVPARTIDIRPALEEVRREHNQKALRDRLERARGASFGNPSGRRSRGVAPMLIALVAGLV